MTCVRPCRTSSTILGISNLSVLANILPWILLVCLNLSFPCLPSLSLLSCCIPCLRLSSFPLPLPFLPQFRVMCPTIPQLYHTDPLRTSSTSSKSSSSGSLPRTWSTSIGTHISLCPPRVCSVLLVVYDTTFALKLMMTNGVSFRCGVR